MTRTPARADADVAPPVVVVVGPTASGKTALSLDLAEALDGEVVNTDAYQLYRGMDVGTAKLPPAERRGVPHHLLDRLEVTDPASVAEFQGWARAAVAEIRSRGKVPVLVGGSALYTRAVVDRFDFPGTDPALRADLTAELDRVGPAALHQRLAEVDPAAAAVIEPGNGRRVVRALEVVTLTGRPFRAELPEPAYALDPVVQVGVRIDRPALDARIERRVDLMWEQGFVAEVRGLLPRGLAGSPTASRALGYQQLLDHLAGATTEEQARAATVAGTRRFARRQEAWYRRDPRITWVGHDDPDRAARAVAAVNGVRSVS